MSFLSWSPLDRLGLNRTSVFSTQPKSLPGFPSHLGNQILVTPLVSRWLHFSVCCLVAKIQTELTLGASSSAILLLVKYEYQQLKYIPIEQILN